jgi:hypothetical protein
MYLVLVDGVSFESLNVNFIWIGDLSGSDDSPARCFAGHPLFACGGKRVFFFFLALFPAKLKRGPTSAAMSG